MRDAVGMEGVYLALHRQVLLDPSRRVVEVEIGAEGLQPSVGLLLVGNGTVSGNCAFHDSESILLEIDLPISQRGPERRIELAYTRF